jgi:hypothetical protein
MTQSDKPYSDPDDQRSIADALSSSGSIYDPQALANALGKEGLTLPPGGQPRPAAPRGMQPWALDAQVPQTRAEQVRRLGPIPAAVQAARAQQIPAAAPAPMDPSKITMAPQTPAAGAPEPQAREQFPQPAGAGGTPAQTIPEHWVQTMDPASRAQMAEGQREQVEGVGGQSDAEAAAADEMARASEHGHEDLRVQQLLDKQQLDEGRQALETHAQQLNDQAVRLANQKVDPEHYMATRSAGQKVMMALSLMFSGAVAGLKGGPNQTMEMIKGAIDDDNKAQMQNIENSRQGVAQQQGILADKMKLFGNKEAALAAARQEQLQGVAAQIDDVARQYQSPQIMAKAEQLKGQLREHFGAEGAATQKYVQAQMVGGGGATPAQIREYEKQLIVGEHMEPNAAHAEAMRWGSGSYANQPSGFYVKPKGAAPGSTVDLAEVEKAGRAAISTKGFGAFVGQHLPGANVLAPDSAQQAQTLNHYNNVVIPGVMKNLESRMSPEQIAAAKEELGIKPSDPPALREQKLQQLLQFGRIGAGVKGKTAVGGDEGAPTTPEGFE